MGIDQARSEAGKLGLDLVEIAAQAKPPVVRIVNFKKFKYQEAKKERSSKRKTKEIDTKEIWLGPMISEHDLGIRCQQARSFLNEGDRVKFTVKFAGREITHPELGRVVISKALSNLEDIAEADGEPKMVGRTLVVSLKRKKHETKDQKDS
jgi:translation initiation factor IF-3